MRALTGLSCSQSGTSAGGADFDLTGAVRALGFVGLAFSLGAAGLDLSWALLRAGLLKGAGVVTRRGLLALTGAVFWMLSCTGSSTTFSGFLAPCLRWATLEPSVILTEWGFSLRIRVDFFKAVPWCVHRTAAAGVVAGGAALTDSELAVPAAVLSVMVAGAGKRGGLAWAALDAGGVKGLARPKASGCNQSMSKVEIVNAKPAQRIGRTGILRDWAIVRLSWVRAVRPWEW